MTPKEPTAEEWCARLHQTLNPRDLVKSLHSKTLSLDDKDKIFEEFLEIMNKKEEEKKGDDRDEWFEEDGEDEDDLRWPNENKNTTDLTTSDLEYLERALSNTGDGVYAQEIRLLLFKRQSVAEVEQNLRWAQDIIEADIKGRWIVQREIFVKGEVQSLCIELMVLGMDGEPDFGDCEAEGKDNKVEKKEGQLAAYKAELQRLNDDYWRHKQHLWRLEANTPLGPVGQAYEACRQKPNWYLSDWLRRDCAGRGGCCGRKCGCCEKARETEREWNHGHCTSACRCCIQSKECSTQDKVTVEDDLKVVPFDLVAYKTPYDVRVFREYIWGMD